MSPKEIIAIALGTIATIGFVCAFIVFLRHGSRRSSKRWFQGLEKFGTSEWYMLALTRKPETLTVEGWSKSEWGRPWTQIETIPDVKNGVVYVFRKYNVEVVISHLIWTSALKLGDNETFRYSQLFRGCTIEKNSDGNWKLVEKADELIEVKKLPTATE